MSCPNGHSQPELVQKTGIYSEKSKEVKRIEVADGINILAVHDHICKKCGYNKAEIIDQGVKYSDEESEILFQCGKCGYSERINKKSS